MLSLALFASRIVFGTSRPEKKKKLKRRSYLQKFGGAGFFPLPLSTKTTVDIKKWSGAKCFSLIVRTENGGLSRWKELGQEKPERRKD